jgi:hypothetical protein
MESIDVCLSIDTTGSMYPCLTQVRRSAVQTARRLFKEINGLRMAIKVHGDECDHRSTYVTKTLDFTDDVDSIVDFINDAEPTGGGDSEECYERVLQECRALNWAAGKNKVIVVIGDDVPHPPKYPRYDGKVIDWRNELDLLLEMGVKVYGVHAMPGCRRHSKKFYEEIAKKTGGFYLTLDQFNTVVDLVMACCYKQQSNERLEEFEQELQKAGRMSRNMNGIVSTLLGRKPTATVSSAKGLNPVPAGRFQVLDVDHETPISGFVRSQGVTFKKGRGFYELTKPVKVQGYKEIVLMDKATGDIFNGDEVRTILGLPPQADRKAADREDVNLRPVDLDDWRVFIQSTSDNRKLVANTRLLYEVDDWKKVGTEI